MRQALTDEATVVRYGRNVIGVLVVVSAAGNWLAHSLRPSANKAAALAHRA
jgi:hypothetical protein